jgi:ribosomal protein L18
MLTKKSKNQKRGHIHDRIRKKMQGTAERPRLECVPFAESHLCAGD